MATNDRPGTVVACPACGTRNRVPFSGRGRVRCSNCHADLPWLVEAGDLSFDDAVASRMLVLVDVWAVWCGPCRAIAPVVEQLSRELAGRLKVVKVDADRSPAVSSRHRITAIPTLLLYRDGAEVGRQVGAVPAAQLRAWVESALPAG
ncbi:thioredoxin [Agromyces sp. SYSU T00266]|uniref:thioredoxin n=1 Tax=Agromyces zhanjiangensis TaxID=3158562 RepID=UPI00339805A7